MRSLLKHLNLSILILFIIALVLPQTSYAKTRKSVNIPFCFFCFGSNDYIEKKTKINNSDLFYELMDNPQRTTNELYLANKKTSYWFILGVWVSNETVINISHDTYIPLTDENLVSSLQSADILPGKIPEYSLSLIDYLLGYSSWIFIFLSISFYFVKRSFSSDKENNSDEIQSLINHQIMKTLCYLAKVDGEVDINEVSMIKSIYERLSGESLDEKEIHSRIENAPENKIEILKEFDTVSEILNEPSRSTIAKAVLLVALSDGEFSPAEKLFFEEIVSSLRLDERSVDNLMSDVLSETA